MVNLLFELPNTHALLWAGGILAFTTVVIGVVEKMGLRHVFNWRLTAGTGVLAPVGELETAVSAHELVLFFGGNHAVALSATDEPCEWEHALRSGAWIALAPKERLYAVVFGFCYHRFVVSLVPPVASFWILKPAIVERLSEKLVDCTSRYLFATLFSGRASAIAPLLVGEFKNVGRGVQATQHQVPHAPNERKTFRVLYHIDLASQSDFVIQITRRRGTRVPTLLCFSSLPTLYVSA